MQNALTTSGPATRLAARLQRLSGDRPSDGPSRAAVARRLAVAWLVATVLWASLILFGGREGGEYDPPLAARIEGAALVSLGPFALAVMGEFAAAVVAAGICAIGIALALLRPTHWGARWIGYAAMGILAFLGCFPAGMGI